MQMTLVVTCIIQIKLHNIKDVSVDAVEEHNRRDRTKH